VSRTSHDAGAAGEAVKEANRNALDAVDRHELIFSCPIVPLHCQPEVNQHSIDGCWSGLSREAVEGLSWERGLTGSS
jgi:hypothetical protein